MSGKVSIIETFDFRADRGYDEMRMKGNGI